MPEYSYRALNWLGVEEKGVIRAEGAQEAAAKLHERGLSVISISEQVGIRVSCKGFKMPLFFYKPKTKDFMVFCRQFATMSRAGITALRCLQLLSEQEENPLFKDRISRVALLVEEGSSLADSFRAYKEIFPSFLINMVVAGEASGNLDEVLERLAEHFEKQYELKQKIKAAVTYPKFLLATIALVFLLLMTVVFPTFTTIFERMEVHVPLLTRLLLAMGKTLLSYWYLPLLLSILLFWAAKKALQTERGSHFYHKLLLSVPFLGPVQRAMVVAQFCRTLSVLLSSGVVLLDALSIVSNIIENKKAGGELQNVRRGIMEGRAMAGLLAGSKIFPPMVIGMINVGEQTGTLDNMLYRVAVFYEAEAGRLVEDLGTILEPVLILVMSVVVGVIALSVLLPVYEVFQVIR